VINTNTAHSGSEDVANADAFAAGERAQAWREAREDADDAYGAWCSTRGSARGDARAVFLAAADREAAAEAGYLAALRHDA